MTEVRDGWDEFGNAVWIAIFGLLALKLIHDHYEKEGPVPEGDFWDVFVAEFWLGIVTMLGFEVVTPSSES